jgi:hypothetical protein
LSRQAMPACSPDRSKISRKILICVKATAADLR